MLTIKDVSKSFGDINVIKNINMEIKDKEIVGLLGVNGAGKTTMIKMISDLLSPTSGEILLDNRKITMSDINVLLSSQRGLLERLSGFENVYYFSALKGIFKPEVTKTLEKYKEYFDLLKKPVNVLSLGQRQVVSLIITLVTDPRIVCLDEPSNGLDLNYKNDIVSIIKKEKEESSKVLLITSHDLFFLYEVVDKFYIIHNGEICDIFENSNLTVDEIQSRYESAIRG